MLRETSTLACLLLSHSGAGLTALFAPSDRQMLWYIGVPSPFRAIVWRCVCIYINTDTWSWKCVFLSRDAFPTRESIGSAQDGDFLCLVFSPLAEYSFVRIWGVKRVTGCPVVIQPIGVPSPFCTKCGGTSLLWGGRIYLSFDSPSECLLLSVGSLGYIPLMHLLLSDFSIADLCTLVNGFLI